MISVPWDLRRRGLQDSRRHDQRVREAIQKNLKHLITQEAIITSNRGHMIKLPIRISGSISLPICQRSE